jgi:hypothetical protein
MLAMLEPVSSMAPIAFSGSYPPSEALDLKVVVPERLLRVGIVVIAHNRPNYLQRVLERLKGLRQIGAGSPSIR